MLLDVVIFFLLGGSRDRSLTFSWLGDDHDSLVLTLAQIRQDLVHLVNERGVARQVLHLLVGDNNTADSLGQVNKKRRVAHVILRDLSLIVSILSEVSLAVGSEDGKTNDRVANHDCTVLHEH